MNEERFLRILQECNERATPTCAKQISLETTLVEPWPENSERVDFNIIEVVYDVIATDPLDKEGRVYDAPHLPKLNVPTEQLSTSLRESVKSSLGGISGLFVKYLSDGNERSIDTAGRICYIGLSEFSFQEEETEPQELPRKINEYTLNVGKIIVRACGRIIYSLPEFLQ